MMITSTYVVATLFHSSSRYELISTLSSRTHSKLVLKSAEEGLQLSIRPSMSKLGILLQSKDFPLVISTKNHWAKYRYNQCVFHYELASLKQLLSPASKQDEIELMQELKHPNIVKYIDTIKTKAYLHIVLEYVENGSLQNVIRKFGSFSESLTAIYITQVLKGLEYLHVQGVLHRDIKAANILTTKEGMVKLADFGVATKLSADGLAGEQGVVGSPYWIAPEIIEMSTPTAACDIWSVGCIVIELLTGKPPYYELAPMAALFRIVQDDYPPLPEGISQALRDFLLLCFQKEPVMRSSAEKLLRHAWLQNSSTSKNLAKTTSMLVKTKNAASTGIGLPLSSYISFCIPLVSSAPLYTHLHPSTPLYTPLHPPTPTYTHLHPPTPLYTPLHPSTPFIQRETPRTIQPATLTRW